MEALRSVFDQYKNLKRPDSVRAQESIQWFINYGCKFLGLTPEQAATEFSRLQMDWEGKRVTLDGYIADKAHPAPEGKLLYISPMKMEEQAKFHQPLGSKSAQDPYGLLGWIRGYVEWDPKYRKRADRHYLYGLKKVG